MQCGMDPTTAQFTRLALVGLLAALLTGAILYLDALRRESDARPNPAASLQASQVPGGETGAGAAAVDPGTLVASRPAPVEPSAPAPAPAAVPDVEPVAAPVRTQLAGGVPC